ncbi:hypothetical protein JCM11491_003898 [Sporobolomyces phaffii]
MTDSTKTTAVLVDSISQRVAAHVAHLAELYSSVTRGGSDAAVAADLDALEQVVHAEIAAQTTRVEQGIRDRRAAYRAKVERVDEWRLALGTDPTEHPRRPSPSSDDRVLEELEQDVDDELNALRARIEHRGREVVRVQREVYAVRDLLGDGGTGTPTAAVRLDPRDDVNRDDGWQGLDLRIERYDALEAELESCRAEVVRRQGIINECAVEISSLHKELGPAPTTTTDDDHDHGAVIDLVAQHLDGTHPLAPTLDAVARVERTRRALEREQTRRHETIQTIYDELYHLWTMLGVDEAEMDHFVNQWCGSSLQVIDAYQTELDRMLHLRRSNLSRFIESERELVAALWDESYVAHADRIRLLPAFALEIDPVRVWRDDDAEEDEADEVVNENVTEDLLRVHERYRAELELSVAAQRPVLDRVAKYFAVVQKGKDLEAAAANPARLTARGSSTILLLEERDRKRVAKEKPKLEAELRALISEWESTNRTRFLVNGMPFLETLDHQQRQEEMDKENKRRTKLGTSATSSTTTRPLRAQPTGTASVAVLPLKRQMTGASTRSTSSSGHAPPPAKRQVAMTTGSSTASSSSRSHHALLGDSRSANHDLHHQYSSVPATPAALRPKTGAVATTTGTRSRAATLASGTPGPAAGGSSGMRVPTGWGAGRLEAQVTGSTSHRAVVVAPQRTGGFRPRPSTTTTR